MFNSDGIGIVSIDKIDPGPHHIFELCSGIFQRFADYLETPGGLDSGIRVDVAIGPYRCGARDEHTVIYSHCATKSNRVFVGRTGRNQDSF